MRKIGLRIVLYFSIWYIIEKVFFINIRAESWSVLFVGFEAAFIGLTQIRNNNDNLEIELFTKFNERYALLNQDLKLLKGKSLCELIYGLNKDDNLKVLEDYINLCCEEYYCYKVKKKIPFQIWQFWHEGIMQNMKDAKCIYEFWQSELRNSNSFYIDTKDGPFEIEARKDIRSCFEICVIKIEKNLY
jgi:hypothetical protein